MLNQAHDIWPIEQINLVLSTAKNPAKDTNPTEGEKYNIICN